MNFLLLPNTTEQKSFTGSDYFTVGIQAVAPTKFQCTLGGSSKGITLESFYFDQTKGKILEIGMKEVFNEGRNCLFHETLSIKNSSSKLKAAEIVATLEAIKEMELTKKK